MVELSQENLRKIKLDVSNGLVLDELLLTEFPDAKISVIRGYDNFSYEFYTNGAFFNQTQAEKMLSKIPKNGSLPDTYTLVTGTAKDLYDNKFLDVRSQKPFDPVDIQMVYSSLNERLNE